MTAPFVKLDGLGKIYGRIAALDDVSLTIREGEFLTFLGPSGSGKSTTLMALAGFIDLNRGRVLLEGRDITGLPPEKRDFGVVFQGYALFPHMTVAQNVAYPLKIRRVAGAEADTRVREVLERVGLAPMADRPVARLSGGQQQRVALARALIFRPKMLLLDEPLSALDRRLRQEMQQELARLHRDFGTTFLFVTHDQEEALALSDRIVVFNQGRVEQIGTPQEVYDRPANRFVANFLGDMNLIPVHAEAREGNVTICLSGTRRLRVREEVAPGAQGWLALRPERMGLSETQPGGNALPATVTTITYQGTHLILQLEAEDGLALDARLAVTDPLAARLAVGMAVWCHWPEESGHVMTE